MMMMMMMMIVAMLIVTVVEVLVTMKLILAGSFKSLQNSFEVLEGQDNDRATNNEVTTLICRAFQKVSDRS